MSEKRIFCAPDLRTTYECNCELGGGCPVCFYWNLMDIVAGHDAALRQASNEALEEAARLAEKANTDVHGNVKLEGVLVAEAIRSLKDEP